MEQQLAALRALIEAQAPSGGPPRCPATTRLMNYPEIRCDLPAGHAGDHHARIVGHELSLDKDGHTIKARTWQVAWRTTSP